VVPPILPKKAVSCSVTNQRKPDLQVDKLNRVLMQALSDEVGTKTNQ
jgi:hypothetical protein